MECALCRNGTYREGLVTVTVQRGETTVVFKGVPAEVCDSCGHYFLSQEVASSLFKLGEEAVARGAEVEVLRYAA